MVSVSLPQPTRKRLRTRPAMATPAKAAALVLGVTCLITGVAGGLLRAGVAPSEAWAGDTLGQAAVAHATLMMSGFLGTVIGIERAVATRLRWAYAAPLLSALGAAWVLGGHAAAGAWLSACAALVFVGVNVAVVLRQGAAHTVLLLVGAFSWLVGNLMLAVGLGMAAVLPWWFAFLVLTIAAERLEMTRLMRRHPAAQGSLFAVLIALLIGAALSASEPETGGLVYGAALVALAAWLGLFDIARRTVMARGLPRYMAICLLMGYAWLGVAGVAWAGMGVGCPGRDTALHALGLGFVLSMVMGHAPVILPAIARVKLLFGAWFYAPLIVLHGSLILRLVFGFSNPALRTMGAAWNAAALLLFVLTVIASALAWRVRHGAPSTRPKT